MTDDLKTRFDVATALHKGGRDLQEDALITDFPVGSDIGFLVLADGMGGAAAGEIASKIVVTEMLCELKFEADEFATSEAEIPAFLRRAAQVANTGIRDFVRGDPQKYGMGATLVAPVFVEDRMYWISIGDSALYLFRDGQLRQLNEDHSMAPEIDRLVARGVMSQEEGLDHPDRNCLTSVLMGGDIARIDCPAAAFGVEPGDIFIVASDGLQFLGDSEIAEVIGEDVTRPAVSLAQSLLSTILSLGDPDQDNVSISIVKVNSPEEARATGASVLHLPSTERTTSSAGPTKLILDRDMVASRDAAGCGEPVPVAPATREPVSPPRAFLPDGSEFRSARFSGPASRD